MNFPARLLLGFLILLAPAWAADVAPPPTHADLAYGPHARNRLDLWLPPSTSATKPVPLVIFIHGGGFTKGDKAQAREQKLVQQCLAAGVAFASINYRFLGPETTLPAILRDCARALQFLRAEAKTWNLDPARIATFGSSGGAGASLWLAFHPDLADPPNPDPVLRQSTRPTCVGALSTQFTYDFYRWEEVFGAATLARFDRQFRAPLFYGFTSDQDAQSPAGRALRADCDMLGLLTAAAPPVFLSTKHPAGDVQDYSHFLHHPQHAKVIYDRARELGVTVVADLPGYGLTPPADGPRTLRDFLFLHLRVPSP